MTQECTIFRFFFPKHKTKCTEKLSTDNKFENTAASGRIKNKDGTTSLLETKISRKDGRNISMTYLIIEVQNIKLIMTRD